MPSHDPYKSDVYSCGMLLIFCATLESPKKCYNFKTYKIDMDEKNGLLEFVKRKYSVELFCMIGDLLQEKEKERPDFR